MKTSSAEREIETIEARLIDSGPSSQNHANSFGQVVSTPCPSCGAPRSGGTNFCASCGTPLETPDGPLVIQGSSGSQATAIPSHTFQCRNCGSEVATSVQQRSYLCPFCDSAIVTEIPLDRSGRQRPEFVIGFTVTSEQAQAKFFEWLGRNSWFRPGDLARKASTEKQKGVYLPFWHFSMHASSSWTANIGEYWYRTETYTSKDAQGKTVTRTRQVRETEWFPLGGQHQRYYYGFLVAATRGITAAEAVDIQPFQLSSLARYRPYYLAGWMAEEYSVPMEDAIELSQKEFRRRQEAEIQRFLPGDTHSNLSVNTYLDVNGSDLILLPVHVLSYRYGERVYRFLVNGQTGKVIGEKPWSTPRIASFVVFILAVLAAIVLLVFFLSNR